jgi:hypothetical protein
VRSRRAVPGRRLFLPTSRLRAVVSGLLALAGGVAFALATTIPTGDPSAVRMNPSAYLLFWVPALVFGAVAVVQLLPVFLPGGLLLTGEGFRWKRNGLSRPRAARWVDVYEVAVVTRRSRDSDKDGGTSVKTSGETVRVFLNDRGTNPDQPWQAEIDLDHGAIGLSTDELLDLMNRWWWQDPTSRSRRIEAGEAPPEEATLAVVHTPLSARLLGCVGTAVLVVLGNLGNCTINSRSPTPTAAPAVRAAPPSPIATRPPVPLAPAAPTQTRPASAPSPKPNSPVPTRAAIPTPRPPCSFVRGFAELKAQLGDLVGGCLEEERADPTNGDSMQRTTTGLLVWRRADGLVAFTDGGRTWVRGPDGLVYLRSNAQRFAWEAAQSGSVATPGPPIAPRPMTG